MAEEALDRQNLDVYDKGHGEGLWNPDHGELDVPDGWDFLPSGDAFLTRRAKAGGAYWVAYKPRGRNRPHRRLLGLWAPAETIAAARTVAAETAERRAKGRAVGVRQRARAEEKYATELQSAIIGFLGFAPEHEQLARDIAEQGAERAAVVGSGRVGRTRTISLEERAELAARACIRHQYTDYHDQLDRASLEPLSPEELVSIELDDDEYRRIKDDAQLAVDLFLARHRRG